MNQEEITPPLLAVVRHQMQAGQSGLVVWGEQTAKVIQQLQTWQPQATLINDTVLWGENRQQWLIDGISFCATKVLPNLLLLLPVAGLDEVQQKHVMQLVRSLPGPVHASARGRGQIFAPAKNRYYRQCLRRVKIPIVWYDGLQPWPGHAASSTDAATLAAGMARAAFAWGVPASVITQTKPAI